LHLCACVRVVCESVCMSERVRGKMGISMSKFGLGLGLKFNPDDDDDAGESGNGVPELKS